MFSTLCIAGNTILKEVKTGWWEWVLKARSWKATSAPVPVCSLYLVVSAMWGDLATHSFLHECYAFPLSLDELQSFAMWTCIDLTALSCFLPRQLIQSGHKGILLGLFICEDSLFFEAGSFAEPGTYGCDLDQLANALGILFLSAYSVLDLQVCAVVSGFAGMCCCVCICRRVLLCLDLQVYAVVSGFAGVCCCVWRLDSCPQALIWWAVSPAPQKTEIKFTGY